MKVEQAINLYKEYQRGIFLWERLSAAILRFQSFTVYHLRFDELTSFRPEKALFRNLFVNLRNFLCIVPRYVSAQFLDFLDLAKNCSFLVRKLTDVHREFPDGH